MGSMMGGSAAGLWAAVVILAVVVALAAVGWAALSGRTRQDGPARKDAVEDETPRAILQRRYAAGEIGEDEYLRRLAGLSQR